MPGPITAVDGLRKMHRLVGELVAHLGDVLAVVQAHAHDLGRRDGGQQLRVGEREHAFGLPGRERLVGDERDGVVVGKPVAAVAFVEAGARRACRFLGVRSNGSLFASLP